MLSFALAAGATIGGGQAAWAQSPSPSPSPSAAPWSVAMHASNVTPWLSGLLSSIAFVCAIIALWLALTRSNANARASARTDKDLEALRIAYGFWLIIGGMVLAFSVAVVVIVVFVPPSPVTTGDIVAVIASVTSVVGTLTAAFFGVQAAGAGRSQALDKLQSLTSGAADFVIDPPAGPVAGGTAVSIRGNGFTGAGAVNFGTNPGLAFSVVNDGLIRVTSPASTAGASDVDVAVVFPNAKPNVTGGKFHYI